MRDVNGFYYYPDPTDTRSRVYVRQSVGDVEFRLWHSEHPEAWERHGWVPYATIQALAALYAEQRGGAPLSLYDINVAKVLLRDMERDARTRGGERE